MKLTRKDVEKKQALIKQYQKQLSDLRNEGVDLSDKEDMGFVYRPSQYMFEEQMDFLNGLIKKETNDILNAQIIEEFDLDSDSIVLGDTVTILMEFSDEEPYEHTFLLTDLENKGVSTVTTESPVGIAIYGKNVGDTVCCKTPKGILKITILEKSRGIKR